MLYTLSAKPITSFLSTGPAPRQESLGFGHHPGQRSSTTSLFLQEQHFGCRDPHFLHILYNTKFNILLVLRKLSHTMILVLVERIQWRRHIQNHLRVLDDIHPEES